VKSVPFLLPLCVALLAGCGQAPAPADTAAAPAAPAAAPAVAAVARPAKTYRIEDFVESTSLGGASFSHDESRLLFSSNRNGVWNAYHLPVAGGDWTPVTRSDTDNSWAVAFFPADDRMLITRDQGGNELNHLFVVEADGSERDLTPGTELKADFAGFSHDGSRFFVLSNERDARFFDVYAYDSADYSRELIYRNETGYQPSGVSGDGRWIGLAKADTTINNDIYVFDRDSERLVHLSPHEGNAQFAIEDFAPDGSHVLYSSNEGNEFFRLRKYDLASGEHADVQQADWDIAYAAYSHSGRYRAVGINQDGSLVVQLYDVASGEQVPLPELPAGEIRGLSIARSEQRLAFYLNGDRQPSDLYTLPLGGEPVALVRSLNPAIDAADLVDSEVVRFASFDGMQIPNILWKPHQASADNKVPAIVLVHGGPGGQTTRAYNYVAQFLANNGYVVLGINNRGSSGYGKTFFAADDGKHGREPLWDTIEAKKWLQAQDYVDPARIGIMGGSYGGYMTLAALAFHPEEFTVGVNIFGVSNWLRTLESIPPYWESFRQALYAEVGDPVADREFLVATSPLFHADKITKPLIVLQGANDPRVIQAESDDIVEAVRANGVPVEYVLFADEGHGFTKKANQIEGYSRVLAFLDQHLKGVTPAP
jgi:dipeptidyl aminopeptidase/acylaminoacyl peptidase